MAGLGPDYAEANARFAKLSAEASASDPYDQAQAAAARWAAQQDAMQANLPGPSEAERNLEMVKAAQANAEGTGLNFDVAAAQARVDQERQAQAAEAQRSASVGSHMPGAAVPPAGADLSSLPPAPPLPGQDGTIDPNDLTAAQLARFGYASVDPATVAMGQRAFRSSMAGIRREQAALLDSSNNIGQAEKEAQASLGKQLDLDVSRNSAMTSVTSQAADLAAQREAVVKKLVADSTAETQAQMVRVRQTADEAANAQIKDFWADKTTGGRILGIISQALAGAANGLSGQPGASTPLDKVMAADLERQRINLNQKTTTSYREQGILGLMRQNFSSQLEAGAAAYGASINHVDMLAKDIAQRYKTPEAMAKYEEFHAQNIVKYNQAMAQAHNAILGSEIQKAQLSSTMISRLNSANVAANASAAKKAGAQDTGLHLLGFSGPVAKPAYQAMNKHAGAMGAMLSNYQHIKELMARPGPVDKTWLDDFKKQSAEIFAALKVKDDTGKRLEGKEAENLETRMPKLTDVAVGKALPSSIYNFEKDLENTVNTVTRSYVERGRAIMSNPYDLKDPTIGSYIRQYAQPAQGQ